MFIETHYRELPQRRREPFLSNQLSPKEFRIGSLYLQLQTLMGETVLGLWQG